MFKDPDVFSTKRSIADYLPGLPGLRPEYPGSELGRPALVGLLKIVARLDGLRRVQGPQGRMKKIKGSDGSDMYLEIDEEAAHTYPSSMKINYN